MADVLARMPGELNVNSNAGSNNRSNQPIATRTRARASLTDDQTSGGAVADRTRSRLRQNEPSLEVRDNARENPTRNNIQPRYRPIQRQNGVRRRRRRRARRHSEDEDNSLIRISSIHDFFYDYPPLFPIYVEETASLTVPPHILSDFAEFTQTPSLQSLNLTTAEVSDPLQVFRCAICLESYVKNDPVVTKCGHIYCGHCIVQWLSRADTCPKCKKKIDLFTIIRVFP